MKDFFLGLLIGLLIYGQAANALDISFEKATLRDLFAACCLAGTVAHYGDEWTAQQHVNYVWTISKDMLDKREKR